MRRRNHQASLLSLSLLAGLAGVAGLPGRAEAAQSLRVQVDQRGDFVLIGNTLGHECNNPVAPVVGTVGACGTVGLADTAPDIFWRADEPAPGQAQANTSITPAQARSSAVLNIPQGATVTHAFLYWGATLSAPGADTTVTLDRQGGFSENITALSTYQSDNAYQSVADVTSIVQANGSGSYRVSGVNTATFVNVDSSVAFSGFWMVVFYELGSDPFRNLALFEGFDRVTNGVTQNVTLSGFLVPSAGFDAKLGVVTFEGDESITGDQLFFNGGTALSNAQNPQTNFFNSTRSTLGSPVSVAGDLPQLTGAPRSYSGMDLDIVDIKSKVMSGNTSAQIKATSTGDTYYLGAFITSISTFKPSFVTSTKTAVDLNGGALVPGDSIEYTIVAINTGNDASVKTVINDVLPAGVTYVPGSLAVTQGANVGSKSDADGDDQGEYDAANGIVTVRIGAGASAAEGGVVPIGGSSTVKFQVTVDPGTSGLIDNQAVITAEGQLGAPSDDALTDGNSGAAGAPPTTVVVSQCSSDAQCSGATPHCDTASAPFLCVECLIDSHCPASTPTCDPATKSCVCVATGNEVCDGSDNDCNGAVDDGFNVGAACSAGVGACQASGNVVCDGMGGAACDAMPGAPSVEICDGQDNDCDGALDEGCADADGDGLIETAELLLGTNPNDADSDDDGVPDGQEPSPALDSDADGLPNALDPDSDNDGLYDGTEVGLGCSGAGTDNTKGVCVPDADMGATTTSPLLADTDGGGVSDGAEDANGNGKLDAGETDPTAGHGADDGSNGDNDGDGLSNGQEAQLGTNPNDADSDDDGVLDGQEPNPGVDSNGDGLINALDPDSDNDGLFDGTELGLGCSNAATNVSAGVCVPDADMGATTTSPVNADTDGGGVSDGSEDINLNGALDAGETDPTAGHGADDGSNGDNDGDGLSNGLEAQLGTNPNDADTDNDGVLDGAEPNPASDPDNDGLINALDPDSDNDGLFDGTELGLGCSNPATNVSAGVCVPDADMGATTTSPLLADTDGGGVSDGAEDANGNGKLDAGETDPTAGHGADDGSNGDNDGDGLSNGQEAQLGTNPNDADSDDDGVLDGQEPNPGVDSNGDGLINALDPDSDNDGLFDGTELGLGCSNPATNVSAGVCVPDADMGATTTSPVNADTDGGGVSDGSEDINLNGALDAGETDPTAGHGADDGSNGDNDGDGLSNGLEAQLGTNPNDADSDDDGVLDGQEPNPSADGDNDGLINVLDPDSDNDGLFDGTELGLGCSNPATDPAAGRCVPDADMGATTTSPLDADSDDGGVGDGSEDTNLNGALDAGETDPTAGHGADDGANDDADGDGLSNGFELQLGTKVNDADSDDDGVLDGDEPNPGDDSNGDGLINALDPDSDNDGLFDGTELGLGCSNPATDPAAGACVPDADMGATTTSPVNADTDGGGASDGSEDANLNGALDAGETDPTVGHAADDGSNADNDGDGLSNGLEAQLGTDPDDADSDDDGVADGLEPNPAADSDNDGIINALDSDSDNDGLFDGTEMGLDCSGPGTDALAGRCVADADMGATKTSPVLRDTDKGGVSDGAEDTNANGAIDAGETDPTAGHGADDSLNADSDGDGLSNVQEVLLGTDLDDADSDDDGVLDGSEPNLASDSDKDGLINALDADSDNDGLFDGTELGLGCSDPATDPSAMSCVPDADMGATTTSPLDADTDDGGASDGSEDANRNGVLDAGETDPTAGSGADDASVMDSDGDGLGDLLEAQLGSDPNDADSDDDGAPDGQEPNPAADSDFDGLINLLDTDSDNDGLFDGTELGLGCDGAGTNKTLGHCVADADMGATTTSPLDADTDGGGASDGSEDVNGNGVVDAGESDPTVGHWPDDETVVDSDGDGLGDALEAAAGTDASDADSDDDGVPDGQEANPLDDTDGDGIINALDEDSDGDGLFDGTELGFGCDDPATNEGAMHCIADADAGATVTSPLDPDTDGGGVLDGAEDKNKNGSLDAGETDPTKGHGGDDTAPACDSDADCGGAVSGVVCDDTMGVCVDGCRGEGGNGCPDGEVCSSTDTSIGVCAEKPDCEVDADCGGGESGMICDSIAGVCVPGCRGVGGNGCPDGQVCSSTDAAIGVCADEKDEPKERLYIPQGDGLFCAARPMGRGGVDAAWLLALTGLAALARRLRGRA